jgi:hypothetical protein
VQEEEEKEDDEILPREQELQQDFHDTTLLLFHAEIERPK